MQPRTEKTVFDVFAGGGGSSTGFAMAGFRCVGAIENNADACNTFRSNHADTPVLQKDVTLVTERDVRDMVGRRSVSVVTGSPPCQGFSLAGKTPSTSVATDSLWRYVILIGRWLRADAIVIENVPNFLTKMSSDGTTTIRQEVVRALEAAGYTDVQSRILNAADFGVPQGRRRAFIVATRKSAGFSFPERQTSTKVHTYADVLQTKREVLASIRKHDYDVYMSRSKIEYFVNRKLQYDEYVRWVSRKNVPTTLRAGYMKSRGAEALVKYDADCMKVSNARVEHAREVGAVRMLTIEECMAIQTFPPNYVFCGSVSSIYKQIGNAVPVGLARAVAGSLLQIKFT